MYQRRIAAVMHGVSYLRALLQGSCIAFQSHSPLLFSCLASNSWVPLSFSSSYYMRESLRLSNKCKDCFFNSHSICWLAYKKYNETLNTSSSCFMWGKKSFWNDCNASFSLSSNVCLFHRGLLFDVLFSPFLVRDKISRTRLSLWTSLTTASICLFMRRCCSCVKIQLSSISSWCFSSAKVELMYWRRLARDTSSLKLVVESWKEKQ